MRTPINLSSRCQPAFHQLKIIPTDPKTARMTAAITLLQTGSFHVSPAHAAIFASNSFIARGNL